MVSCRFLNSYLNFSRLVFFYYFLHFSGFLLTHPFIVVQSLLDFHFVAQVGCFWEKSFIFSLSHFDSFTVKSTLCYRNRKAAWKVAIFYTKDLSISVPHMTKCFSQSWLWNEHKHTCALIRSGLSFQLYRVQCVFYLSFASQCQRNNIVSIKIIRNACW